MKIIISFLLYGLALIGSSVFAQPSDEKMQAFYPLDRNANNQLYNDNHGEVNNAFLTVDRCGKENSAYAFSKSSSHIDYGFFDFKMKSFTISLWLKKEGESSKDNGQILSHGNQGIERQNLFLRINPDNTLRFSFYGLKGLNIDTDYALEAYKWYNVVFSYDYLSKQAKIYLDGQLIKVGIFNEDYLGEGKMYLAKAGGTTYRKGNNTFFNGKLDELRIYNKSLNVQEIQMLFKQGSCLDNNLNLREGLLIYPNPSSEIINLRTPSKDYNKVFIYNIMGSQIFKGALSSGNDSVDVSSYDSGVYIIKITNGIKSYSSKFIKN